MALSLVSLVATISQMAERLIPEASPPTSPASSWSLSPSARPTPTRSSSLPALSAIAWPVAAAASTSVASLPVSAAISMATCQRLVAPSAVSEIPSRTRQAPVALSLVLVVAAISLLAERLIPEASPSASRTPARPICPSSPRPRPPLSTLRTTGPTVSASV